MSQDPGKGMKKQEGELYVLKRCYKERGEERKSNGNRYNYLGICEKNEIQTRVAFGSLIIYK